MKTLYQDVLESGIECSNHESDLYVLANSDSLSIIKKHNVAYYSSFKSNIDGKLWYDIPFMFDPFWQKRSM